MLKSRAKPAIPTELTPEQFDKFIFPHLSRGKRGPLPKLPLYKIFGYLLLQLYTGCQWKMLPIDKRADGKPEIHYTRLHRLFQRWQKTGCFRLIFNASVGLLYRHSLLDLSIIHGDGTSTTAKKGGDNIGYNGHKHMKGDKVVALCDRNNNVIAPFIAASGNRNESPLLREALPELTATAKAVGFSFRRSVMSLDGGYDSQTNRKAIFNRGMTPNIPENKRNRKTTKRGRKRRFDEEIFAERFQTIERIFAWEDKFRRLLLRFERISELHYAFKLLAYTLINLRHFC
jgi:transposase